MNSKNKTKIRVNDLDLYYGEKQALKGINMDIRENEVTALIGPSGCGKSTFLRCLNRMNDLIDCVKINGKIYMDDEEIHHPHGSHEKYPYHSGKQAQEPAGILGSYTGQSPLPHIPSLTWSDPEVH